MVEQNSGACIARDSDATGALGRVDALQPALMNHRHAGPLPRSKWYRVAQQVFPVLSKGLVPVMLARRHCHPSRARKSSASFATPALHLVKCRRKRASRGRSRPARGTYAGTNPLHQAYRELLQNLEVLMRRARTVLAAFVLTSISSVALAQQTLTGTVTTIDRINGTIAIQPTQSGTVGTNGGAATEQFKVQDGMLNTVHAGDKVTVSVSETGGTKTITKLEKQ
jgi:hypothetical protein